MAKDLHARDHGFAGLKILLEERRRIKAQKQCLLFHRSCKLLRIREADNAGAASSDVRFYNQGIANFLRRRQGLLWHVDNTGIRERQLQAFQQFNLQGLRNLVFECDRAVDYADSASF